MLAESPSAFPEQGSPPAFGDASLRSWQRRALAKATGWSAGPLLIAAAPGAGKTRPALVLAREELDERVRSGPDEQDLDFVPVAADVAPQMNLFGEAGDASVQPAPTPAPVPLADSEEVEDEPAIPVFQRRKDLRARRHRLVSDLASKRRWRHLEANVWINERTGIRRVEEATIAQLERSCRLLDEELFRPARRG